MPEPIDYDGPDPVTLGFDNLTLPFLIMSVGTVGSVAMAAYEKCRKRMRETKPKSKRKEESGIKLIKTLQCMPMLGTIKAGCD
jgi:hypothetical protein